MANFFPIEKQGNVTFDQNVSKGKFDFEFSIWQLSEKNVGFNTLTVLIVHFGERGMDNLDWHVNF